MHPSNNEQKIDLGELRMSRKKNDNQNNCIQNLDLVLKITSKYRIIIGGDLL